MYAYNPRKKTFQQLEKSLVGNDRWDILNGIMRELTLKKGEVPKQHWMIVGPRGIGKSHLLTLLYHKVKEDKKVSKLWLPVLFPEELRMAGDLSKFMERAVSELLIDLERENNPIAAELKPKIDKIKKVPIGERSYYIFSILSWIHEFTGRFILLITENLQHLLGKKISVIEQKKLRAYLQTNEAVLLIGSATTVFEALHDHSNPFYHFFHIKRLEDLSFNDMKALIIDLLTEGGQHEVVKRVSKNEARLRALYSFTGGNPRIAVFLADMLKSELPDEMISIMDKILDELTPYFEAILNEIPPYQEEVLNTLAAYEPAQSPKEIAEHLEALQPTIRNYLMQLKENGYVRVAFSKGKFNYYCLKEYLYRIWYQMRDSSHREETKWLMELLLMLYSPAYIIEEKKKLEKCIASDTNMFYSTMISKAADFIEKNPVHSRAIELCVDTSVIGKDVDYQGKEKELFKSIRKFIKNKDYEKALNVCNDILKINPFNDYAYYTWGYCLEKLERYEDAIERFKKALEISPKSEHYLWHWGNCLRRQNRYEEAISKFREVTILRPEEYSAYGAWGDCLRELSRYEEADEQYQKAISINPKFEDAYLAWAHSFIFQEQYDKAIAKYKLLLEINPQTESAYIEWASLLYTQNQYAEAIEKCKQALKINPDSEDAIGIWGACLRGQKHYNEAIKKFENVLKINPISEKAYKAIAVTLMCKKDYSHALQIFEAHLSKSDSCSVNLKYGQCLLKMKQYNKAIQKFKELIDLSFYCNKVYIDYGQALEKTGKKEEALIAYLSHSQISSVEPDFHEIFKKHISPLLKALKPEDYLKQFYAPGKERKLSKQSLTILLLMLGKYDIVNEHLTDIINESDLKNEKEKQELDLLIFTIKLCIWVKLSEGSTYDALRLSNIFVMHVKSLKTNVEKEKEVSNLILSLFKLQFHKKVEPDSIGKILEQFKKFKDVGELPFNEVFMKVWKCLSEPNSIDAQKYLNEKAIAEVVRSIKMKEEQDDSGCGA